jgi:glycosyltransferase involved in cell wall biosynthesis
MKIYINARFLTQPISGVQRFAIEISKELRKSNLPIVFVSPKNIIHHEIAKELNVKIIGKLSGHLWEQIELQAYVLINKGFLISLCNTAPLFLKNQIVTIHDLAFIENPQWFSKFFSTYYNFLIPQLAKNSKAIITVSTVSKIELIAKLKVNADKITVIYNAVAPIFEKMDVMAKNNENKPIADDYILTVSSHHPRKNFERLVKAFKQLNHKNLKLYIIGNVNNNFDSNELEIDDNIIILENISDEELFYYYRHARLFVFASLYEGFGIPIIEALKAGTQICISDIPVFREICGNDYTYFNPYEIADIKSKLESSLKNPSKPFHFDFTRFSWKNGAEKLHNLLIKIHTN